MNVSVLTTTLDQWLVDWFCGLFGESSGSQALANFILVLIALLLSVVLCSCVGIERERRGRSAGLRTHLLVGVGSAIIMIISIYGFPEGSSQDPARLAAQVITGIGFLGTGVIIHQRSGGIVKGLTTASTIWLVMAIGLACGSFNFILAILVTVIVMVVLVLFRKLERVVTRSNPLMILLCKADVPVMTVLTQTATEFNASISDVSTTLVKEGGEDLIEVTFIANSESSKFDARGFADAVKEKCNAVSVNILNHH